MGAPRRIRYSRTPAGKQAANIFGMLQQLESLMPLDASVPPSPEPPSPWVKEGDTYTDAALGLRVDTRDPTDLYVKARLHALQNLASNVPVSEAWHRLATWAYHAVMVAVPGSPVPGSALEGDLDD